MLSQASRIATLETQMGAAASAVEKEWLSTQNMLYWESATFFVFLIASMMLFFWLYWSDMKRARSTQAFFASVTHELRTPLTSIRLQAESLADQVSREQNPSRHLLAERLLEDTTRLELQVERLLELARVEGGGQVVTQPIDLKLIVDRFIKSWKQTFGTSQNQSRFEIKNLLQNEQIEADPIAFQVILKNLLDNSIKHSQKEIVSVSIDAVKTDDHVVVTFKDNNDHFSGDPAELGILFKKGPSSHGTGVGLYLIKMLMTKMGGNASFHADPKSGFEVRLHFREARADG